MDAPNFITAYRQSSPTASLAHLTALIAFELGEPAFGYPTDKNLEFRVTVVEALLPDFSLADYELVQLLFAEEMRCEAAIHRHDSLYQLCFYLYELRQLPDTFRLYEAKFKATNLDVGILLDREMITVGHEVPVVVTYVEQVFAAEPSLRAHYPTLLEELHGLVEFPDYETRAQYRASIRDYFYGGDEEPEPLSPTLLTQTDSLSGYQPPPLKPWWRFW